MVLGEKVAQWISFPSITVFMPSNTSTVDGLERRDGGMTAVSVYRDVERANSAGVQPRSLNSRDEEPEGLSDLAVHPNSDRKSTRLNSSHWE